MTILNKKIANVLSVLALLGINACDTHTPVSTATAESTNETTNVKSFLDIKAPNDFAFSVFNEKSITVALSVETESGLKAYPGATVQIIAGDSKKLLARPKTNIKGEALYDAANLPTSVPKIGVFVYAAGIPEDTLWYTKEELNNLGRNIKITPKSYAAKVGKKGVVAAKGAANNDVSIVVPAPGVYVKNANHSILDYALVTGALFVEQQPLVINPAWAKTRELRINASTNPANKDSLWAHFMHTGAGYQNAFGYYWYRTSDNPTHALSGIKRVTLFSLVDGFYGQQFNAPKALVGTVSDWKDSLANANDTIVIGYWLHADYEQGAKPGNPLWYTNIAYNILSHGTIDSLHFVSFPAFSDPKKLILGNEDLRLTSSDKDYNDLVVIVDVLDSGNGQPYRCDTTATHKNSRLGFEDKYPEYGDFDFNDMVVDFNASVTKQQCYFFGVPITDAQHGITYAPQLLTGTVSVVPVANGAFYEIGFGVSLGNFFPGLVTMTNPSSQVVINGTETILEFFDFARAEFIPNPTTIYVNTDGTTPVANRPVYAPKGIYTANITFAAGTPDTTTIKFNPFIYWQKDVTREVHMKGYPMTSRGVAQNPASYPNPAPLHPVITYADINGLPWAIEIQQSTKYPIEFQDITGAYPQFAAWAMTGIPATWELVFIPGLVY